tara:strand:- start:578 stop:778 length:201 start_codon:yes stop_codon:yes gene_type:complete
MNFYDVLGKLRVKATATVEESVLEDLQKEDPPVEEAMAILEAETEDEDPQGHDRTTSDGDDREDSE